MRLWSHGQNFSRVSVENKIYDESLVGRYQLSHFLLYSRSEASLQISVVTDSYVAEARDWVSLPGQWWSAARSWRRLRPSCGERSRAGKSRMTDLQTDSIFKYYKITVEFFDQIAGRWHYLSLFQSQHSSCLNELVFLLGMVRLSVIMNLKRVICSLFHQLSTST